ncbi:hypothetical protein ACET3Z_027836 [Daucus carota]
MLQGEAKAKARAAFMEYARARIKEYWARKAAQEVADAAEPKAKKPKLSSEIKLGPEIVSVPADTNSSLPTSSYVKDTPSSEDQIKPQPEPPLPQTPSSDDQIKPQPEPPLPRTSILGVIREKDNWLYDINKRRCKTTGVPGYINKFCTMALEKYNNEKGTNYRYVCLLLAHEGGQIRGSIYTLKFRASQSDSDFKFEAFTARVTSGYKFSKGEWGFVREVEQVSLVPGSLHFAW